MAAARGLGPPAVAIILRKGGMPDRANSNVIPVIFYVLRDIGNRLNAVFSDNENER